MNRWVSGVAFVVAVTFAQISVAQTRKDVPKLFEEAQNAHDAGNYKEALALLDQCLTINPGFIDAYMTRGSTKEQLNDIAGALTDYSIYLETRDNDNEAHLARGLLRFKQGHFELAEEDFHRLLTLPSGPTNTIILQAIIFW